VYTQKKQQPLRLFCSSFLYAKQVPLRVRLQRLPLSISLRAQSRGDSRIRIPIPRPSSRCA